ncbi:MAG: aldose epimerase [Gammaproteobacteria bacterium]|nr:aldose epimerase [Gammaproteobacteria bacterium]
MSQFAGRRIFGSLPDGTAIEALTLGGADGLQAEILSYGGILRGLTLPTRRGRTNLVLGLPDLDAYVGDSAFLGSIVGRFSNRIAGASFTLDGQLHRLSANDGSHHLHGGELGFSKRAWRVLDFAPGSRARLRLGLRSLAGEDGYPGNLDVSAEFIVDSDRLELRFEARCDAPTPVSLTYHPYFNLSGATRWLADDHWLRICADRFLPVTNPGLIPTGELCPVVDTPFDYRRLRMLRPVAAGAHPQLAAAGGYDHCFVLNPGVEMAAELRSVHSGVAMRIGTDQPGLQFYDGHALPPRHPGAGRGICLEPQGFPNAPNETAFPSAILRPGLVYSRCVAYTFSHL